MEQFPEKSPNPVISLGNDGKVLSSNVAGESLLHEWGVGVGEKLPSCIGDFVQRVISRNCPEKIEIKVGKKVYLVAFHPLPERVNIYGFDISGQKGLEEKLQESEAWEMANLELADIIDAQVIQSIMNDLYKLAHITMALVDLKGNVLVGVGWQDICTKFHRVHAEACKYCRESDTELSSGVLPGEFKTYKCKNNMWDIATPIIVGGQHVGNAFSGQFFFEDEPLDYDLFRSQARKYGFNEEEYITALETVPRLSREDVDTGMSFLMTFANMVSQLGYSNIKLSKSLAERDILVDALRESEEKYRNIVETANEGIWIIDAEDRTIYVNKKMTEMLGYGQEEMIGRAVWDFTDKEDKAVSRMNVEKRRHGLDESHEFKFICKDGSPLWTLVNTKSFFDKDGKFAGSMGMLTDITKRKEAEDKLKKTLDNLGKLVEERTTQLEKAYNSLKESENGLAEAQKMAHIGNWEWNIATDEAYWSDEMYHIFGRDPEKLAPAYNEYLSYIYPDDLDYFDNATKRAVNGKPYSMDLRIILSNGEERTIHMQSEVIFDEKNMPIRIKGTIQDITERKKAEENIQSLANIVESSQDAIVTMSLDGIISSWNKGAEQIYGYSSKEILGKNASILAPDNLKDEAKKLIDRIKRGIKIKNYETSRLREDGTLINVSITLSPIFDSSEKLTAISVIARDITERVKAGKLLEKAEDARKKEIHHRIKNNLQVISSLLDLQAEKFNNRELIKDSEVLEAFRESQNRVISMVLIHEELYKGEETDTLNFSEYLPKLAETLFQTYKLSGKNIHLSMDLEENAPFNMDTAVPLGIIVNELVSNSLKHAFPGRDRGVIRIKLRREKNGENKKEGNKSTSFTLTVSDNGVGIPENLDIEDLDGLGIQLITTLVDQLDGKLELKRNNGTEFAIRFTVTEEI